MGIFLVHRLFMNPVCGCIFIHDDNRRIHETMVDAYDIANPKFSVDTVVQFMTTMIKAGIKAETKAKNHKRNS